MKTAKSKEENKNRFFKLKTKIAFIKEDIKFIQLCKINKVY